MKRLVISCVLAAVGAAMAFAGGGRQRDSASSGTGAQTATIPTSTRNSTPELPADIYAPEKKIIKFDQPVVITVGQAIDPSDDTLPEGDTAENNQWTRFLGKVSNIVIKTAWTAAVGNDYDQKISLSIASNTLPDALVLSSRNQFVKAYQAGLLMDITQLYTDNACTFLRDKMAMEDGKYIAQGQFNGRLWGIPSATVTTDGVNLCIIRQDWLDRLGLPAPRTLADVERAAKAFLDAGLARIGIASPDKRGRFYCTFLESSNNPYGFDPVFQVLGANPGYWVKDSSGKTVYGTIQPEMRNSLAFLNDWYRKGLLDPEMGVRDMSDEVISSNATGIFFGPWWAIAYGNMSSLTNDPSADWQFYPIYDDEGQWISRMKEYGNQYIVINKNASPETAKAVIVTENIWNTGDAVFDTRVDETYWQPLRMPIANLTETELEYEAYYQLLNGEKTREDFNLPSDPAYWRVYLGATEDQLFSVMKNWVRGTRPGTVLPIAAFDQSNNYFQRSFAILTGDRVYSSLRPDREIFSEIYGMTDGMQRRWANLWALEQAMVVNIITGKQPLSYFDQFVAQWKAEGGDDITAEVQRLTSN
jgi:multiple sugar transport system substrate-binding protein/putative aldouronate transport system substrate-binding protein